jgi:hypothetical protein
VRHDFVRERPNKGAVLKEQVESLKISPNGHEIKKEKIGGDQPVSFAGWHKVLQWAFD